MRYLSVLSFLCLLACTNQPPRLVENTGNAQGSTYQIKYVTAKKVNFSAEFEQIFKDIDNSMSIWVPTSLISQVNENRRMG